MHLQKPCSLSLSQSPFLSPFPSPSDNTNYRNKKGRQENWRNISEMWCCSINAVRIIQYRFCTVYSRLKIYWEMLVPVCLCMCVHVLHTNEYRSRWMPEGLKCSLIFFNLLVPSAPCLPKLIIRNTGELLQIFPPSLRSLVLLGASLTPGFSWQIVLFRILIVRKEAVCNLKTSHQLCLLTIYVTVKVGSSTGSNHVPLLCSTMHIIQTFVLL